MWSGKCSAIPASCFPDHFLFTRTGGRDGGGGRKEKREEGEGGMDEGVGRREAEGWAEGEGQGKKGKKAHFVLEEIVMWKRGMVDRAK